MTDAIDWDDLQRSISVNSRGQIVYESVLKKQMPKQDLERLFDIVADNIVEDEGEETIDWAKVKEEYRGRRN